MIVVPAPAFIPVAEVAETVIDAAIETNHRPPIAFVKVVSPAAPGPIGRRPQVSRPRRGHPRPRHPVIIVPIPRPVTGRPDVAFGWTDRLLVHRQFRRPERNSNSYVNLCVRQTRQQQQTQDPHQRANLQESPHLLSFVRLYLASLALARNTGQPAG